MQDDKWSFNPINWSYLLARLITDYHIVLIDAPSLANAITASMISAIQRRVSTIRLGCCTSYDLQEAIRVIKQAGGLLLGNIAVE